MDVNKSQNNLISHRVVADHLRSISFLIAEGVMPSNEGSRVRIKKNNA